MAFNPIGMGSLGDDLKQSICACEWGGKGCGPIIRLLICACDVSGPGVGPYG